VEKTFEYRIYPNATQQELMQKTFGCCCWVYNKVLAKNARELVVNGVTAVEEMLRVAYAE